MAFTALSCGEVHLLARPQSSSARSCRCFAAIPSSSQAKRSSLLHLEATETDNLNFSGWCEDWRRYLRQSCSQERVDHDSTNVNRGSTQGHQGTLSVPACTSPVEPDTKPPSSAAIATKSPRAWATSHVAFPPYGGLNTILSIQGNKHQRRTMGDRASQPHDCASSLSGSAKSWLAIEVRCFRARHGPVARTGRWSDGATITH